MIYIKRSRKWVFYEAGLGFWNCNTVRLGDYYGQLDPGEPAGNSITLML